jgi:hypothetical protein
MFVQLKEEELIGSPSTSAPRYLQQPFLPPFFVPFFTSLTSFRLCSSGLGELTFQGRVTR